MKSFFSCGRISLSKITLIGDVNTLRLCYFVHQQLKFLLSSLNVHSRPTIYSLLHTSFMPFQITGCSSGFGFDAVKRLDRLGCQVFAGVRDDKAEQKIRDVCSTRVIPVRIDIAKHESVQACYEQIIQLLPEDTGRADLVIVSIIQYKYQTAMLNTGGLRYLPSPYK